MTVTDDVVDSNNRGVVGLVALLVMMILWMVMDSLMLNYLKGHIRL